MAIPMGAATSLRAAASAAAVLLAACSGSGGGGQRAPGSCAMPGDPLLVAGAIAGPAVDPVVCQKPVVGSTLPGTQVKSFGPKAVGTNVAFDVPAGAASVTIVSQAVSAVDTATFSTSGGGSFTEPNTVAPLQVSWPAGPIYSDLASQPADASGELVYYFPIGTSTGTMTIPNTSAMLTSSSGGLAGGSWQFTVSDLAYECHLYSNCLAGDTSGVYDVTVLTKPGPPADTGTIDAAFYLVTQGGLAAAAAPADPHVQRLVATLDAVLKCAGVRLGTVTFHDVQDWARQKYAAGINADRTGPCDEIGQMSTLSLPGDTMSFFLVDDITSTLAGGPVVGLDGTIPGPSTFGGTIASGAAVSIADLGFVAPGGSCSGAIDLRCGDDMTAFILAHEAGHFLGLYHTTEGIGAFFDPMADTPKCGCSTCKPATATAQCQAFDGPPLDAPYLVSAKDCSKGGSCGGGDNLMFWQISPTYQKGFFSRDQAEVMRANPLVR